MKVFGFSINTLTLFGLTLATGLVVDDAIVVIENIERTRWPRRGTAPRGGRAQGMEEVSGAVVAISLVLVAVFVPVAFFRGTTGAIYRQFALTIAASVALSAFCALTLEPGAERAAAAPPSGPKAGSSSARFDRRSTGRRTGLCGPGPAAQAPAGRCCGLPACLGGHGAALFQAVPTGFIPDEDQGYIIICIQGPEGMSLDADEKVGAASKKILSGRAAQPETSVVVGGFFLRRTTGPNIATCSSCSSRGRSGRARAARLAGIVERLRGPFAAHRRGARAALPASAIRGVGNVGGFQFMVEDTCGSGSLETLGAAVQDWWPGATRRARAARRLQLLHRGTPLLDVEVDRQKAKALGVPIEQIFSTMQLYMGSQYVNDFNYASRTYRVLPAGRRQFRDKPVDIGAFYVRSDAGRHDPAGGAGEGDAHHLRADHPSLQPLPLGGDQRPGRSGRVLGTGLQAMEALAAQHLPQGWAPSGPASAWSRRRAAARR